MVGSRTLHDEDDDDWPDTNPRRISTFRTFSKGSSSSSTAAAAAAAAAPTPFTNSSVPMTNGPLNTLSPAPCASSMLLMSELLPSSHVSMDDADEQDSMYDMVADDEYEYHPAMEFKIDLQSADRRFGFSVIGGLDEGFPPRIDEISAEFEMVDLGGYVIILVETKDKRIKLYGSPADRTDLEVGDEILEVNGKSLENATHTEVISYIHQCIKSRTICLRVKRKTGNKLALDLAQHSNVQDAFVIAVEQQARERLEKLSALQKIKPVDMTKLSKQLSQESSSSSQELNGLIEGSPIYVTSVPNLSLSTSNLDEQNNRTDSACSGGGGRGVASRSSSLLRARGQHPVAGSAPDLDYTHDYSSGSNGYAAIDATKTTDSSNRTEEVELKLKQDLSPNCDDKMRVGGGQQQQQQQQQQQPQQHHHHHHHHHHHGGGNVVKSSALEGDMRGSWDTLPHREMAVDVPESFRGSSKAPPRYPPPKDHNQNRSSTPDSRPPSLQQPLQSRGSESLNSSTTSSSSRGAPLITSNVARKDVIGTRVFSPTNGRDGRQRMVSATDIQETSLTADVVGNGSPQHPIPTPAPRTIHSPTRGTVDISAAASDVAVSGGEMKPTEDQLERMRKYQEDIRKRREEEERIHREQDFLRTSLRGSKKLQALEQSPTPSSVSGFDNSAFLLDDDRDDDDDDDDNEAVGDHERGDGSLSSRRRPSPAPLKRIAGVAELIAALQRVQAHLRANGRNADGASLSRVDGLLRDPDFQQALKIHNKVQQVCCFRTPPTPLCTDAQGLTQEVLNSVRASRLAEASELSELLNRYDVESLLLAHDTIAKREAVVAMSPDEELLDRASQYTDDSVKIVRIDKTNEPLGATVRNEGEAVIIGRIVKGGVAEKSGLLHEGDEILEVNNTEMRGKSVNDVCDILANMTGTLTFLVVPTQCEQTKLPTHETVMHVKAHFDYDPEEDLYIPCRELGISFRKGDILHILNQADPNWWQAFREGEDDQSLAGLIPSKSFQQQRAAMEQKIVADSNNRNNDGRSSKKGNTLLLCAHKRNTKKSKTKLNKKGSGSVGGGGGGTLMYNASYNVDSVDPVGGVGGSDVDNEILTYEEVALYYPRANRKRPIVLIGPPNIGRHELRQKLMEDVDRFAAAVPHTSRPKKDEELDGQDYYFISRQQFESDILGRKFVEHGEYEKNYYGTSLDAIRTVVNSGKICVLNLHPQSLKILKASDLKPFVVYVAPPLLDKLRQNRTKMGINAKDDELKEIIVKAREMDESYGHYFDLVIVNSDLERAYDQLLREINALEREPQWVPAVWLLDEIN